MMNFSIITHSFLNSTITSYHYGMFVHTACQLINSYSTLFIQTGTIGYNAKSQEYKTVDPDQSLILL